MPCATSTNSTRPQGSGLLDPDDLAAFQAAVADAKPLPASGRVHLGGPMPPPRPLQRLADEQAALRESLHGPITLQDRLEGGDEPSYLRNGVANSVLRDLRRGRWAIQDEIDLHGMNREEARDQLACFLAQSLKYGRRCVTVRSPPSFRLDRNQAAAARYSVLVICSATCQGSRSSSSLIR